MNMNKLKLSWNGSDWTQSIEGDTGTSTVPSTKTVISLLSALTMAGFAVSQVVLEDTSTHLLGLKYAPDIANKQRLKLNNLQNKIGQTSGSAWTHYNPMLKEYHTVYSTNSDGVGSQEVSVSLQGYSSLTSTRTEAEWSSFRSDTTTQTEDSPSLQDVRRQYMVRNALDSLRDTSALQREAETQSSSGCVVYQQSQYQVPHQVTYYGNSAGYVPSEEPFSWQYQTGTRRDRNS